jgi:LPPG:FO 2-phospho-L-lactate transferase
MIVALAGGVGGAKLAHGLARVLPPDRLLIAVNSADDFTHLGMHISPDLDSVMYKLAGISDPERGWGLAGETWGFMEALARLGGEDWFNLGDRDMATHVERTRRLTAGETLSQVTAALAAALGVTHPITPMTDDRVRTWVRTPDGALPFQHYFVRLRCDPIAMGFDFEGAEHAAIAPALAAALADPALEAIVICPSNPFVSIGPMLAIPSLHAALTARRVPLIAVSPLVGGMAVKGPAAKMMAELELPISSDAVAAHYGSLLDGLVIDAADAWEAPSIEVRGIRVLSVPTLMKTPEDESRLAETVLGFARDIAGGRA